MAKDIGSYFLEQGQPIVPKPKPKQYLKTLDILNTKAAVNTLSPRTYTNLVGQTARKAFDNKEISASDYYDTVMPLFGETGEMVTEKIKQYDAELDRYADGGRVNFNAGGSDPKTGQGFQKGNTGFRTKDGEVRNVTGKNQFTTKTPEEVRSIINNPKYKDYTPYRFRKENLLTRTDTDVTAPKYNIKFKKSGPLEADPKNQKARDIKRGEAQINLEGRKLKLIAPSGYQVHHIMPLAGGEELRTGDYAIVSKEMNAKMSKYNKKINKLVNEAYSLDFSKTENLKRLKDINNDLFDILETVKKDLPKKYKGLLGFNKLTPVLDTFDDKGRQVFYAEPQGIDYKKSIAGVQGDKVKDTKRSVMQDMVNKAKTFAFKPVEGLVENYKKIRPGIDKATQMFPGKADNAIAAAIDFPMMYMSGAPALEAAGSAASMFINKPNVGKAVNLALESSALSDEEKFLKRGIDRREGIESMLQSIPSRFKETINQAKGVKDETEEYIP
jgi:hypothetical protein